MNDLPKVSVLVAARNEEDYILSCLKCLNELDYPVQLVDIWIGNDASEDNTEKIIRNFIQDKSQFYLLNISESLQGLKGKANVLAQLTQKAKGALFFFTDADVNVPSTWLKSMLTHFQNPDLGIVIGFTLPQGKGLFAKLQALDWTWALSGMQLLSYWQIPTTAMGNNMVISKDAYNRVGGYENLPFSITEDFILYQAVVQNNFLFKNIIQPKVTAFTQPEKKINTLFQQRLRWMYGAWQSHWSLKFCFLIYVLIFPTSVLGLLISPYSLGLFIFKFGIDFWLIFRNLWKIKQIELLVFFPLYELMQWLFYLILITKFLFNKKIEWKGRSY